MKSSKRAAASSKRRQSPSVDVRAQLLPLLGKLSDEQLWATLGKLAAARTRQARLAKGLTIRQAAKLAGVPESAWRRLEGQRV